MAKKTAGEPAMTLDQDAAQVARLSRRIALLLYGNDPDIKGDVLAELTVIWLSGFWPIEARDDMLARHINGVKNMLADLERKHRR